MCLSSLPSPLALQLEEMSSANNSEHCWLNWKSLQSGLRLSSCWSPDLFLTVCPSNRLPVWWDKKSYINTVSLLFCDNLHHPLSVCCKHHRAHWPMKLAHNTWLFISECLHSEPFVILIQQIWECIPFLKLQFPVHLKVTVFISY